MNAHQWAKDAEVLLAAYPHKTKQRQKILVGYFEAAFREGAKREALEIISVVEAVEEELRA